MDFDFGICLGIAVIGDYRSKQANPLARNVLKALIKCGVAQGYINKHYTVLGHGHQLA